MYSRLSAFLPREARLSLAVCFLYASVSTSLALVRYYFVSSTVEHVTGGLLYLLPNLASCCVLHNKRLQLNKALLSSYSFNGFFTLLSAQLGVSWLFCVISRDYLGNPMKVRHICCAVSAHKPAA
jgi:hypothetical protein